ncbi:cyclic nucleotide-gated channel alpha-3-like isoform X4 [Tubulanus polymorphus]|uniref:cyclic nucleotide-gated channel alpha-3-like isoform X4 n=1 Tax=Tubulanus polymorphus TaxID=672921 RepID=UPI003DA4DA86
MQRLARHSVASVVSTQSRDSIESANMYNHRSSISVVRGPGGAGNRWAKLRTTVKATNIVSEPAKRKRKASNLSRQDSFLKRFSTRHGVHGNDSDGEGDEEKSTIGRNSLECKSVRRKFVIHPVENVMFLWLGFITAACLYNIWTSIAREAFTEIQDGYLPVWFACDAICDFLYLFDVVVQLRTGFLEKGLLVYNSKKLAHHYVKSHYFIVDLITLLPLDLLQLYIGIHPLLRFPRFLKCYRAGQFKNMVESRTMYPNLWRVVNLCHILFLFSHWFAAFYYLISKSEDYTGVWAYPKPVGPYADVTRKYLKSLYWSTLTLTTIGDLPPPDTNWQYVFTILSYLLGVFCFATIVGQVGNVITNRNANRLEFERLLDGAKNYMRTHNVPPDMQRRVQRWYDYAWSRGRVNGGGDINSLGLLPDKLKTELALHVNLETLKKVTIFQECQPEFLHDLVLKMRAYIFTPGDLVCRKGEVAREMFIIADGILEVISDTGEVLTQMGAGDFFGEIGILNLDGGINSLAGGTVNRRPLGRRTADVRSVGYSELFTLSREDVLAALKDHPEAEAILKEYGQKRLEGLRQNAIEYAHIHHIDVVNEKNKQIGLTQNEAAPSPITDLLGVPLVSSFRRLSQCSNNSESQGIDIRPTPSPESDTSLASGRSREVNANMDTVSDVLESMKQVLILKLGSGNEALVKRVKDLEDINDQQSTKIKLLEREIQTLKGEFVDDEAVSVSPITQHHEKSPSVATTSNCADPDGVDDVMDTKL